jgi:hypothetical protein
MGGGGGGTSNGGGTQALGGGSGGGSGAGGGVGTGGGGGHVILDAGVSCDGGETFTQSASLMLSSCSSGPIMNCHTRTPYDGNLNLTTAGVAYSSLVNVPSYDAPTKLRVAPGDPLGSFLVQKLTNTQGVIEGGPMPQGEGIIWQPPDAEHLRVLECWILEGAQNN